MFKFSLSSAIAGALLALGFAAPAHARSNRAWVSGHGTDIAGCSTPASPCRTLQYVLDNIIAPGGEIDILDPAGYGAVAITKSVSIINDGVGTAGIIAISGNAITVTAGDGGRVRFKGVTIEGQGAANGVQINSAAFVEISDSTISGFDGVGLNITPANVLPTAPQIVIQNCTIENTIGGLVNVAPTGATGKVFVDLRNVSAHNSNGYGVNVDATAGALEVHTWIIDGDIHLVSGAGVGATSKAGSQAIVVVSHSQVHDTGIAGISSRGAGANVYIGGDDVMDNNVGLTSAAGGSIASVGNNFVTGNGVNGAPTSTVPPL